MLYVLTAADLGAVGPDVWDGWKCQVLTDLYHRAMQQLAGDSPATTIDTAFEGRRAEIRQRLGGEGDDAWFGRHIDALTPGYLSAASAGRQRSTCVCCTTFRPAASARGPLRGEHGHAADHRRHERDRRPRHLPQADRRADEPRPGNPLGPNSYARRRTGARPLLGPRSGLRRRTAVDRIEQSTARWSSRCGSPSDHSTLPSATKWTTAAALRTPGPKPQIRVNSDNSTSDRYTIIDVFAYDRTGLLYSVTRALFELGLSVWRAKISTYLDPVLDVFYVTDQDNQKIEDQERLDAIKRRMMEVGRKRCKHENDKQ